MSLTKEDKAACRLTRGDCKSGMHDAMLSLAPRYDEILQEYMELPYMLFFGDNLASEVVMYDRRSYVRQAFAPVVSVALPRQFTWARIFDKSSL
jgi:hypothetical protein